MACGLYVLILGLVGRQTRSSVRFSKCYKVQSWPKGGSDTRFVGVVVQLAR